MANDSKKILYAIGKYNTSQRWERNRGMLFILIASIIFFGGVAFNVAFLLQSVATIFPVTAVVYMISFNAFLLSGISIFSLLGAAHLRAGRDRENEALKLLLK